MEGSYRTMNSQAVREAPDKREKKILKNSLSMLKDATLAFAAMGFFIGRVSILNTFPPFGIAFLMATAVTSDMKKTVVAGISIIIGVFTKARGYLVWQTIIAVIMLFTVIRIMKIDNSVKTLKAALIVFVISLAASLITNPLKNGSFILDEGLMGFFNSTIAMALVYIYYYSIPVIIDRRRRRLLSNEEMICLSIICGIIISGMSDIFIYGISIKVILSVLAIIVAAYRQGADTGAAIGCTIGLISCISSNQVPVVIGGYSLCGLLSGIFRDTGKIGVSLGFIVADMAVYFYLGGSNNVIGFKELAIGIIIFMLLPYKVIDRLIPSADYKAREFIEQKSYVERMKDLIRVRISRVVDVFNELSKTLKDSDGSDKLRQSSEVNSIINSVVDRVCPDCDVRNICWARDFYNTYQNMFQMVDIIQADGKIDSETVPEDLKKKCIKLGQLIKTMNYIYDIYRVNYKWRKKAQEGKIVVAEQLDGINAILKRLSEDIRRQVNFKSEVEEEIAVAMDKEGIVFNDVVVSNGENGRYEVNIYKRSCSGKRECIKKVEPVVSRVLNRKMERDKACCVIKENTNLCYFRLVEAVKYQMTTGVAREAKDKGGISGDNYSFVELNEGKYMIVLSDGMGTGPAAALESDSAVTLLEKYLEAGFDEMSAIKAINSAMVLKSPDDNYATIDLSIIDLYTGDAEFVKIGAVSTFIKRYDGTVEVISSNTLPVGILNNVDIESKTIKLNHGDLLIMTTDGVQQAGGRIGSEWMVHALEDIKTRNPQQVAKELLDRAKQGGNERIDDDMTVLVSRIWEVV